MKKLLPLVLLAPLYMSSCVDAPEFADTPKIEYNTVLFKEVGQVSDPDSLIIVIDFEDGDGDMGLDGSEVAPPFNLKNYYSNKTGDLFDFNNEGLLDLLTIRDRETIDSLPPYEGFARCINWDTNPDLFLEDGTRLTDTVYFQFNKRHHNIFIRFFVDRGSGFEEFDWRREIDCSTNYDGRFPNLNESGQERNLEGTIRYGMTSVGFRNIFAEDRIKLSIQVVDRSGKFSNIIETPPFRLSEID